MAKNIYLDQIETKLAENMTVIGLQYLASGFLLAHSPLKYLAISYFKTSAVMFASIAVLKEGVRQYEDKILAQI